MATGATPLILRGAARIHHIPAKPTTKRDASGGNVCNSRYTRSVASRHMVTLLLS
jgi:hypothetical protein